MDDVVAKAGVAKGAIYHHFASKEALFTRVLESIQEELASAQVPAADRKLRDPLDQIAGGVLRYLLAATGPGRRRILLVDGPAVLGWRKWREIDDRHFGAAARMAVTAALGEGAAAAEIEAVTHLLLGAVMEAALVCATAKDPKKSAREQSAALRKMLEGLRTK
ncbi:MAG: TetR/AcrR family transcriptional regulator [Rhizomicrobium sp.]